MHISLPSHKYLMASAAVEGLLTVVSFSTIHRTSQLLCECQASVKASIKHCVPLKGTVHAQSHSHVPEGPPSSKTGSRSSSAPG